MRVELDALLDAVEAARDFARLLDCTCDIAWTGRGLHDPACLHVDGYDLAQALDRFDFEGSSPPPEGV
jgi:hypothetical protein